MSSLGKEFAVDKVNEHIKAHLSKFQKRIQVMQMLRLPCLTDGDRQEIRASCDREGNNTAMFTFLDRLRCRDSWVPLLIEALREDHVSDLAEELWGIYNRYLPSSQRIPPARGMAAAPSDAPPPNGRGARGIQCPGDCHTPVQEHSLPAEKSELAVKPKATVRAREPQFSPPSDSHVVSNSGAAVGEENAAGCQTARPSIPVPMEERQFLSSSTSKLDAGSAGQQWDGRQPHPVMVKNGRFGNRSRPGPNVVAVALPATDDGVPGNHPEENYYSLDGFFLAPAGQRESQAKGSLREVKAQLPRGDQTAARLEELAVPDNRPSGPEGSQASGGKPRTDSKAFHVPIKDTPRLPPAGPLTGNSSAKSAHLSQKPSGTQPAPRTPNTMSDHRFQPPLSNFDGGSSMDVIPPNSLVEFSAPRSNTDPDDFKPPETKPFGKLDSTAASAVGQDKQATVTLPPAVVDRNQEDHVFLSNPGEQDVPCKPGVLASVPPESSEDTRVYSGTSERLCLSSSFSLGSDPLLVSDSGPAAGLVLGSKSMNGTGSASRGDAHKDDPSIRTYGIHVAADPSMDPTRDCEKVSLDWASSLSSPDISPDPATEGQGEARGGASSGTSRDSLPKKKARAAAMWTVTDKTWVLVVCALASVALVAFGLYKKK